MGVGLQASSSTSSALLVLTRSFMVLSASVNSIWSVPSSVKPVQEGRAAEHGGELLRDVPEHLLDGGAVADEGDGRLEAARRDVAHGRLHVVGDPLREAAAVLVLQGPRCRLQPTLSHSTTHTILTPVNI